MVVSDEKAVLQEITFHFYRLGKTGEVIILLHGWDASKTKLLPLGKSLKREGWQVFILDLPGFGKSGFPLKAWNLEKYVEFLLKVINRYWQGEKVYLFGHSFGGRIAIKFANLYPERVKGIILCGSAGISRANLVKRKLFLFLTKMGKSLIGENKQLEKLVYKLAGEGDYQKTSGVMRETFKLIIDEDLGPILPGLKIPVLILWGKKDRMTKYSDALEIKKAVKQSKLISFAGSGHQLPYKKPELLVKKIKEWSQ